MLSRTSIITVFPKKLKKAPAYTQHRNVQVSVIGAANNVGANVAILLKQNSKIRKLQLYDDDEKVKGIGLELGHVPGGPAVTAFSGDFNLYPAVQSSDLIVVISRYSRKSGQTREQLLEANAPAVQKACQAIAEQNPNSFIAISTNPINSIVPFASALMYKYSCYNPCKMFGITHIDTTRSRIFAAQALNVNPQNLSMPVIGGHSEETIVPLFSNIAPACYCVDACQADTLTRLVRKAGIRVLSQKQGIESATLALAWSIQEFIDLIIDAIRGNEVTLNCYVANTYFGTRFFSGPTSVGPCGITKTCFEFPMNEYESYLLNSSVPVINKDVQYGEEYVRFMDFIGKG